MFPVEGSVRLTKTDNSTYVAGTLCLFGKEDTWWVISTKPEMELETKQMLRKHFVKLGYKDQNIAVPGVSPLIIKSFNPSRC